MSSSKARSLRERMSIDPDEPAPVSRPRRPRSGPRPDESRAAESDPADVSSGETPGVELPDGGTPGAEASEVGVPGAAAPGTGAPAVGVPSGQARSVEARSVEARSVEARSVEAPAGEASRAEPSVAEPPRPAASPRPSATRSSSRRVQGRRQRDDPGWSTALDDPAVSSGGNGYRSFYVSDEVFARFRAAVYWTARRPDAPDVPDNMSVGVEDYMDQLATDLERRFNGRTPFPPTPEQVRSHRRRQNGGR